MFACLHLVVLGGWSSPDRGFSKDLPWSHLEQIGSLLRLGVDSCRRGWFGGRCSIKWDCQSSGEEAGGAWDCSQDASKNQLCKQSSYGQNQRGDRRMKRATSLKKTAWWSLVWGRRNRCRKRIERESKIKMDLFEKIIPKFSGQDLLFAPKKTDGRLSCFFQWWR